MKRRELEVMPYDMAFETENGNTEMCHATGYEVHFSDDPEWDWWNEYTDSEGKIYYGR